MSFKTNQRKSARQERGIARDGGGRRIAGSGNQASSGLKGDVSFEDWLVEAKITSAVRYTLNLATWRQIETQAIRASKEPAMVLEIAGRKLVVIDYNVWLAFISLKQGLDAVMKR